MDPGRARASGDRGRRLRDRRDHGQLRRPGRRAPRAAATPGVGRRAGRDVRRAAAHGRRRRRGPCERAQGAGPARAGARARRAGPDRRPGPAARRPAAAALEPDDRLPPGGQREHGRARSRPTRSAPGRARPGAGSTWTARSASGRRRRRGAAISRRASSSPIRGRPTPQVAQRPLRLRRRPGARPARPRGRDVGERRHLPRAGRRAPSLPVHARDVAPGARGRGVGRAALARARGARRADRAHLPARDAVRRRPPRGGLPRCSTTWC